MEAIAQRKSRVLLKNCCPSLISIADCNEITSGINNFERERWLCEGKSKTSPSDPIRRIVPTNTFFITAFLLQIGLKDWVKQIGN